MIGFIHLFVILVQEVFDINSYQISQKFYE